MLVGKTQSSVSQAEIFSVLSETEVLSSVFPEVTSLPCTISSPLRQDKHPSFGIYLSEGGHVRYKDFVSGECGGLLDLLCKYWGCTFTQALNRISSELFHYEDIAIRPKRLKTLGRREHKRTSIQVVVRPWHDYDYDYWASYGVNSKGLHYAEIYPISYKIVTKYTDEGSNKYIFPADKYAYCFVERKEGRLSLKIYQPFNTRGYKWCSKMDASVIGLWTKIPEYGDKVVICSSLKDALCVACQLHLPTLCLQGEGYSMSDTAVSELKRRYDKVYISFDTDSAGLADAASLAASTGFINIVPDLGECKDYSDYYKSLKDKDEFKKLKHLFI